MKREMTECEMVVELRIDLLQTKAILEEMTPENLLYNAYVKRVRALEMAIELLREYRVKKELETSNTSVSYK